METTKIEFEVNEENKSFKVKHNLEDFGLDIEAALANWLARTTRYTVQSFCKYVVSKDPINIICTPVL